MAIGLEEEARDELLCEIDHWRTRCDAAEGLLRPFAQVYDDDLEHDAGPLMDDDARLKVAMKYCRAARAFLGKP